MRSGRGFSITEILVVLGVIVVLLGLLFPALAGIRKSGLMTKSMANMRQIGTWMGLYSQDNRDFIVPSQFDYDYAGSGYKGKVRSVITGGVGGEHQGTWADILWTVFEIGVIPEAAGIPAIGHDYRYDSPDGQFYGKYLADDVALNFGDGYDNPLRSAAVNSRNTAYKTPTPYGCGASEVAVPGYFAANNFFAAPGSTDGCSGDLIEGAEWYTNGQIKMPEQSMYLVDSVAGETIAPEPGPYLFERPDSGPDDDSAGGGPGDSPGPGPSTSAVDGQVDFRYSDMCLMLLLDGHVEPQPRWDNICDLDPPAGAEDAAGRPIRGRGIRIRHLTLRSLRADLVEPCP
jgi:type II secretory pathway pseudopilin PulG